MARTQKYLREKFGGVEDAMLEDDEEDEEEQESLWGGKKKEYYHGDNADYEAQSSDDDGPLKEEGAVKKLQMQKAESYTIEDFGLDVIEDCSDRSDRELTLEEMSAKRKGRKKYPGIKEAFDDTGAAYEEVKKDLSALSKEEQMDVLYSSAPELVGLLSELNDAIEQLEKKSGSTSKHGGNHDGRRSALFGDEAASFALVLPSYNFLYPSQV
ncbi:hypothetical protein ACJW31_04G020100 [Castanea mollissima]